MRRAYKFRLRPNATQTMLLEECLESHRRIYNECLARRKEAWENQKQSLSFYDLRDWFNSVQKDHIYWSQLNNNSAHETIRRVDRAYQAFFRRVKAGEKPGYPRFRGRDRYDSIPFGTYPNGLRLFADEKKIRVQHVGKVRVKLHRDVLGKIKQATIKREADKWYVVFSCELPDVAVPASTLPPVGIDVGLESFLTTSDGEHVDNPRYLKNELPELRVQQRKLCRAKKGGKNRRKQRKRVAKLHVRIKNLRREHHHITALDLIRRYGLIAVESLNIKRMLASGWMSRAIADAAWGGFLNVLRIKAESAGVQFVEVNARGTSQECSGCGVTVKKDLSVRQHKCPDCGLVLHRDHNAALNILQRALGLVRPGPAEPKLAVAPTAPRSAEPSNIIKHRPVRRCASKQKSGVPESAFDKGSGGNQLEFWPCCGPLEGEA